MSEEKKLLNKVIIFVFFAHKMYSRCFIKLRLNHWCHIDYINDVFTDYINDVSGPGSISVTLLSMQGQRALGFHKQYIQSSSMKL